MKGFCKYSYKKLSLKIIFSSLFIVFYLLFSISCKNLYQISKVLSIYLVKLWNLCSIWIKISYFIECEVFIEGYNVIQLINEKEDNF